jgi:hypothetical protein
MSMQWRDTSTAGTADATLKTDAYKRGERIGEAVSNGVATAAGTVATVASTGYTATRDFLHGLWAGL